MTRTMAGIQHRLPADAHLVSFTVDPDHDTPAVLKTYAGDYKADPVRWHFLTGTKDQMYSAAADMKVAAKPAEGETPILHSEKLLLVDADGNIRGYYNSKDPEALDRLVSDSAMLVKQAATAAPK